MFVALGGAIVIALGYGGLRAGAGDPLADVAAPIDLQRFGDRVLVIAPHPDDETLGPGGLVSELRAQGSRVRAVVLTSGDGFKRAASLITTGPLTPEAYRKLGRLRHQESEAALASFGVPPEDRLFLCYADGSLNTMWDRDWDPGRPHLGLNGATAAPYDYAWRPGRPYCGANLASDLATIVADFRPTSVVYPDADDTHHDHWAAAAFVDYSLAETGYTGQRFTYLVHFGQYPFPWAHLPAAYLRPPTELLDVGTGWVSLPISGRAETAKANAIGRFRSQLRLSHMNVYLRAFIRRNELFGTYKTPTLTRTEVDGGPPASSDALDVVVREPRRSGVASLLGQPGTVSEVRMVRGPKTVWMGVSTFAPASKDLRYVYHLRLIGGEAPSRLDVTVTGSDAQASVAATNSLSPTGLLVHRDDATVWIGFPTSLLDGRDSGLVSGAAYPKRARGRGYASAWRPFKL
jgi:N-acetyl-1-D-myo-inositol-2-amino-2-deoxy-alpha-D-glucopyranoside deacetylase